MSVLVSRSLGYDDNGMELHFSDQNRGNSVEGSNRECVDDFVQAMNSARPSPEGSSGEHKSNIAGFLRKVFADYTHAAAGGPEKVKKKTIIVLTDGAWKGMMGEYEVDEEVHWGMKAVGMELAQRTTKEANGVPTQAEKNAALEAERPITIQFIRFGHDRTGRERLRRLDDDLCRPPHFYPYVHRGPLTEATYSFVLADSLFFCRQRSHRYRTVRWRRLQDVSR